MSTEISVSARCVPRSRTGNYSETDIYIAFSGITPDLSQDERQREALRLACKQAVIRELSSDEHASFIVLLPEGFVEDRDKEAASRAWNIFYAEAVQNHSSKKRMGLGAQMIYRSK